MKISIGKMKRVLYVFLIIGYWVEKITGAQALY